MALTSPTRYAEPPRPVSPPSTSVTAAPAAPPDASEAAEVDEPPGQPGSLDVVTVLGEVDDLAVLRQHEVRVVEKGRFTHATCAPCGWRGPARRARANAVSDAVAHC